MARLPPTVRLSVRRPLTSQACVVRSLCEFSWCEMRFRLSSAYVNRPPSGSTSHEWFPPASCASCRRQFTIARPLGRCPRLIDHFVRPTPRDFELFLKLLHVVDTMVEWLAMRSMPGCVHSGVHRCRHSAVADTRSSRAWQRPGGFDLLFVHAGGIISSGSIRAAASGSSASVMSESLRNSMKLLMMPSSGCM